MASDLRATSVRLARLYDLDRSDADGAPLDRMLRVCLDPERTADAYLRALEVARRALQLDRRDDPESAHELHLLGAALYRIGRTAEAQNVFDEWQSVRPPRELTDPMYPPFFQAMAQAQNGRKEQAEVTLRQAEAELHRARRQFDHTPILASWDRLREEARQVVGVE